MAGEETLRLRVKAKDRNNSARLLESATMHEIAAWRRERVRFDDFCFVGLQTSLKHRQSNLATTLNEIDDLLAIKRALTTKCKKLINKTKVRELEVQDAMAKVTYQGRFKLTRARTQHARVVITMIHEKQSN